MTIKYKSSMGKSKGMKTVDCKGNCGNKMEISSDSVSGTCWRCVNNMMAGPLGGYMPDYGESESNKDISDDQEKSND